MGIKLMKSLLISTGRAADGDEKYFERITIERKTWSKIKQKSPEWFEKRKNIEW